MEFFRQLLFDFGSLILVDVRKAVEQYYSSEKSRVDPTNGLKNICITLHKILSIPYRLKVEDPVAEFTKLVVPLKGTGSSTTDVVDEIIDHEWDDHLSSAARGLNASLVLSWLA
jgi:hypothetical protein